MKKAYFIIMFLFVALFSASLDIDKSRAAPQCCNTADDDGDLATDMADLQCTSSIDDDEAILAGNYYVSFQDLVGDSFVTENCAPRSLCSTYDGTVAGCVAGWSCPASATGAACNVGTAFSGTSGEACTLCMFIATSCSTPYEACDCTCAACTPDGGACLINSDCCSNDCTASFCVAAAATTAVCPGNGCEYDLGENMFNCPADCLPPGIPNKLIPDVIDSIISWLLGFATAISVLVLIYGGVCYVFSSGDAQKAENAKKVVKYALLGILIAGISFAIIKVADMVFH